MHCRPSDLLGLQDPVARYCFDRAAWMFGSMVEADLAAAEDSGGKNVTAHTIRANKQRVLDLWIPAPAGSKEPKRYKDPAAAGKF